MTQFISLTLMAIIVEGLITYLKTFFIGGKPQWQMLVGIELGVMVSLVYNVDIFALPKSKLKMFCSEECRRDWWKINKVSSNRKAYYCLICSCCGKEFESYGNGSRKYCSHACYIQDHFKVKEGIFDDAQAV